MKERKPFVVWLDELDVQQRYYIQHKHRTLEVPEYFQATIRFHSFDEMKSSQNKALTRVLIEIIESDDVPVGTKVLMALDDFSELLNRYSTSEYIGRLKFKKTPGYLLLKFMEF